MRTIKFSLPILIFLFGCGDKATEPEELGSKLAFDPLTLSIPVGQIGYLKLKLENINEMIFGVSMRIAYNNIIEFDNSTGFRNGPFFGEEAITFIREESSVIFLTLTLQQGQNKINGSGVIGEIPFVGKVVGSTIIYLMPTEVNFYDSDGNIVIVPKLEIQPGTVHVVSSE